MAKIITPATILETFSEVGAFTKGETGTPVSTDMTSALAEGGTGIYLGTDSLHLYLDAGAAGDSVTATRTVNWDLSGMQNFCVRLYVPGGDGNSLETNSGYRVWLYNDSSQTNGARTTNLHNNTFKRTFESVILDRADFSVDVGSGLDWDLPIRSMRVSLHKTSAAGVTECYFDGFFGGWQFDRVPLLLSFDDADEPDSADPADGGQYSYLFQNATVQQYRFKGTLFINSSGIDTSGNLSSAELTEMNNAQWPICNHGANHDDHTTTAEGGDFADQDAIEASLTTCRDFIRSKGWSNGKSERWFAAPNGTFSSTLTAACAAVGITRMRSASPGLTAGAEYQTMIHSIGHAEASAEEWAWNWPRLRALNIATSTTELTNALDKAILRHCPTQFYGHSFPVSGATSRQMAQADMDTMIALFATYTDNESIEVMPLSDFDELIVPSRTAGKTKAQGRFSGIGQATVTLSDFDGSLDVGLYNATGWTGTVTLQRRNKIDYIWRDVATYTGASEAQVANTAAYDWRLVVTAYTAGTIDFDFRGAGSR